MFENRIFQTGDIVKLKSGGPDMSIGHLYKGSGPSGLKYECHWFSGSKASKATFDQESLVKVEK